MPQMAAASVSVPRGVPTASVSPRGFSKINKWVWPRHLSTTVSALKLEAYEILCMPCKNGISFTYGPSALLKISPTWFSKPIVLGAHLPSARPPGWGTQCASWMPNSLARTSCLWVISSWIWVFTKLHLCHSFPSCCGSFFMSLVAENLPARL